jgi:hypothetical protein
MKPISSTAALTTLDLVEICLQGAFFMLFLVPSIYVLTKRWYHLDYFSRWMIFIY